MGQEEQNQIIETPTFADAKGTEGNQHAKALAKKKAKDEAKAKALTSNAFYTAKGDKVLKLVAKPERVVSVYIGNKHPKKHGAQLESLIKTWKEQGVWLEPHEAKEKMSKLQADLAAKRNKKG